MSGGGLMLKIDCRQWMQSLILGGLDTLKFSAKPRSEIYKASFLLDPLMAAIFVFFIVKQTIRPTSNSPPQRTGYRIHILNKYLCYHNKYLIIFDISLTFSFFLQSQS